MCSRSSPSTYCRTPPPVELLDALKLPGRERMKIDNGGSVANELEKLIRAPKGSPASDLLPRITVGLALLEASKEYLWGAGQ